MAGSSGGWEGIAKLIGGATGIIALIVTGYTLAQGNLQRWQTMDRTYLRDFETRLTNFETAHPEVLCLYARYDDAAIGCTDADKKLTRNNVVYVEMVDDFADLTQSYDTRWCKDFPVYGDSIRDCYAGRHLDIKTGDPYGVFGQVKAANLARGPEAAKRADAVTGFAN